MTREDDDERWEFTAPKYFDFSAANPEAYDEKLGEYFDGRGPRALATPPGRGRRRSIGADVPHGGVQITDAECAFMRDPENRGVNGDVDRASPRETTGQMQGRTPRRLGAPQRAIVSEVVREVSRAKTPKSIDKTPVRRSPRLAMLAMSSGKTSDAPTSSRGRSTMKSSSAKTNKSRLASQSPTQRVLRMPNPMVPRVALIAKHKQAAARENAARVTKPTAIAATSRLLKGTQAQRAEVEKFRSRKEKLRAFEMGGRTTDYEDLTQIPAPTTTTRAVSPKFTRTRRKEKLLTTEERELLEIQNTKLAMERERERRRASSCALPYTIIKSKVAHTSTAARGSKLKPQQTPVVDDVSEALRRSRARRISAPTTTLGGSPVEHTPMEDVRKRKRISITGAVLTEITPFQLSTEQRGAYHQRKFARLQQEEAEREKFAHAPFRANPVPAQHHAGVSITRSQLAALLKSGR